MATNALHDEDRELLDALSRAAQAVDDMRRRTRHHYTEVLEKNTELRQQYTVNWTNQEKWSFNGAGQLQAVTNRNGLGYTCFYAGPNLTGLMNTFGQILTLTSYPSNRVHSMTDWYFEGGLQRFWYFDFDDNGDLAAVVHPGTVQHNFEGMTRNFTYLNSQIITDVAADGQAICQNGYNPVTGDCTSRAVGDGLGSLFTFVYNPNVTTLTSPLLNVTDFLYTAPNPWVDIQRQFTRGLRPGDPAFFDTQYFYNTQSEVSQRVWPRGNSDNNVFDEFNPTPENRGNLLSHARNPVPGDPSAPLVETLTFEPNYQFVKTYVSERGNAPAGNPIQYTTTWYYDYEEAWLGDLNGDGIVNQNEGNVVKRDFPTVTQPAVQAVSDTFTWNPFTGLVLNYTDPVVMVTNHTYDLFWNLATRTVNVGGLNLTTVCTHNTVGLRLTETDPNGNQYQSDWNERTSVY